MATSLDAKQRRLHRVTAVGFQRILRLGLFGHPALRIEPRVEDFRSFCFGMRAGPTHSVESLFHELAHAAQFGAHSIDTRVSDNGSFVFKLPTKWVYSQYVEEPETNQATMRELETFAFQLHLMRLAGVKKSKEHFFKESALLMKHMHDWWHVEGGSDDARALTCQKVIEEKHQKIDASEVLRRLKAWLDAMVAKQSQNPGS